MGGSRSAAAVAPNSPLSNWWGGCVATARERHLAIQHRARSSMAGVEQHLLRLPEREFWHCRNLMAVRWARVPWSRECLLQRHCWRDFWVTKNTPTLWAEIEPVRMCFSACGALVESRSPFHGSAVGESSVEASRWTRVLTLLAGCTCRHTNPSGARFFFLRALCEPAGLCCRVGRT